MYIIRPTTITDAMLHSTNVPESDYTEYNEGTPYSVGDYCIITTTGTHNIYLSLKNTNIGNYPPDNLIGTDPYWFDCGKTNRWKPFDEVVGSQASQSEMATWVLSPGLIDSISIMQVEATEIQITLANQAEDIILNGDSWDSATGTTQPTSWDKVGTPSDFTIDSNALRITADSAGGGISQTVTVTPETEMQLLGVYKNTSGDIAQYAVYDVTHSADIIVATDLASSTVDSTLSYVFTVPAGCTSIKVSILAKSSGDIVWFDKISLSPTTYNETFSMLSTINVVDAYTYYFEPIIWATSITKLNLATAGLPPYSQSTITVRITNTRGTAKCGVIVVGLKLEIGSLQYGVKPGLESFSTITEDPTFGTWNVIQRSSRKTLKGTLLVKNTLIDFVLNQLATYDTTLLVWVGHESYDNLCLYGIYRQFEPSMSYPNHTLVDFEIRGVI